jgi:hypothetical protein
MELKGIQRRIIVYPNGPAMQTEDGIEIMPFHIFAKKLSEGLFP